MLAKKENADMQKEEFRKKYIRIKINSNVWIMISCGYPYTPVTIKHDADIGEKQLNITDGLRQENALFENRVSEAQIKVMSEYAYPVHSMDTLKKDDSLFSIASGMYMDEEHHLVINKNLFMLIDEDYYRGKADKAQSEDLDSIISKRKAGDFIVMSDNEYVCLDISDFNAINEAVLEADSIYGSSPKDEDCGLAM